ncbi:MAG: DNA cytosine methyltransferase, partial [Solobacterium sp.]|nr:DNA cytosine methyltransferase [Solobacterium sp.]
TYTFSEGGMSEYDSLELPGRTMLTSEGSVNRSTHLLKIDGKYRLITPIEAERLQDFPDDWTRYKRNAKGEVVEVSDRMRMFFMGNALVTGIVKRIGDELQKIDAI